MSLCSAPPSYMEVIKGAASLGKMGPSTKSPAASVQGSPRLFGSKIPGLWSKVSPAAAVSVVSSKVESLCLEPLRRVTTTKVSANGQPSSSLTEDIESWF